MKETFITIYNLWKLYFSFAGLKVRVSPALVVNAHTPTDPTKKWSNINYKETNEI